MPIYYVMFGLPDGPAIVTADEIADIKNNCATASTAFGGTLDECRQFKSKNATPNTAQGE